MEKNKLREVPRFNNIKEIIYNSVKLYAKDIAFTTKITKENKKVEYKETTYEEFLKEINALGTALFNMGLKGKRIAIVGKNSYKWALAHITNLLGNIVSVPLDKGLQLGELESSLIRSKADAIVFDEKHIEEIEKIKNSNKTNISKYICMSKLDGYINLDDLIEEGKVLIEKGNNEYINEEVDSYKMSILLFTSGTTEQSKAVMLSQYGIATNIYDMQIVESFYNTDVNIAFLPFHHIFGSTGLLVMLSRGVKTVFPDGLRYIKENLKEYGVSVFVGVPILVDKIYQNIEKEIKNQGKEKIVKKKITLTKILLKIGIDIRRKVFKEIIDQLGGKMRFVISGGAPLDKEVAKGFENFGIHLAQGYGLTETSPVIAAENDKYQRAGSIGFPMRHTEVKIIEKDQNGIGELIVKGPNVMLGYYENEEKTKEVLKDGWFYTGDLAYMDKDGFLYITGRKKDMIVLKNGKKVFPEELETLINKIEEIEESLVYGMPIDNDMNNVKISVKVVYNEEVVKEKYKNISEEELYKIIWEKIKEVNKTLPQYKYIKNMILTKEPLIKTTTNKVKRNEELKLLGILK